MGEPNAFDLFVRQAVEELVNATVYPPPVVMDGPYCPFLTCLKPTPHEHPVCEVCGAVRYGNLFCDRCNEMAAILGPDR